MKPRRDPAYRKMTDYLESLIAAGVYVSGGKLPTRRDLAAEFKLTAYAVQQGLEYLAERGLVVLRHGSGVYVAQNRQSESGRWQIAVFVGSLQMGTGYLFHALTGLQEAAFRRNCTIALHGREYYQRHRQYPENLSEEVGQAQGLIFLGEYDAVKMVPPHQIPSCGIEMGDTCGGVLSPLSMDPFFAAELAVNYFQQAGKKHLVCYDYPGVPVFAQRMEILMARWQRLGGTVECHAASPWDIAATPLPNDPKAGYCFCSGSWCESVLRRVDARDGAGAHRKFSILSYDGKSRLMPDFFPVSCIYIDWRAAGGSALEEVLRRIENPSAEPRRIYVIPRLDEINW